MADNKYRFITRADFDGIVSGALLKELGMIDKVLFVEPREMQEGRVKVTSNDITTNLPYVEGVHLCFDNHVSEVTRVGADLDNHIMEADAPSASRVVYEHFGGKAAFPNISEDLLTAVDRSDTANYTIEDILAPDDWGMLSFIVDPRTGLDRLNEFTISKDQLMIDLMTYCRHNPIEEIMQLPDVAQRVASYNYYAEFAELQIRDCSTIKNKLIITDLRDANPIYAVNRFLIYALYPECNVSMNVQWVMNKEYAIIAVGKSIIDRSSTTNIGNLMLEYGGGGHAAAGTCRVEAAKADQTIADLVERINADG